MKHVCPYCFTDFSSDKILYQCPKGHYSEALPHEKLLKKGKCKQSGCNEEINLLKKFCPNTGTLDPLPKDILENPSLFFSIVGIAGSGKTNYITVMLEELLNNTRELSLHCAPIAGTGKIHEINRDTIYKNHEKPAPTTTEKPAPQIWSLQNLKRQSEDRLSLPAFTFTIFDGAGEHFDTTDNNGDENAEALRQYIIHSEAIMLVIDPMTLQNVREKMDHDIFTKSVASEKDARKNSVDVVNNLVSYIKDLRGISASKKIKVPVAIILTKMDAFDKDLKKDFGDRAILKPSPHADRGAFLKSDSNAVNNDIKAWLKDNNERAFLNAVEANFSEYVFFGVSSYGEVPESEKKLASTPHPRRVLDPILWFFANKNFIDTE